MIIQKGMRTDIPIFSYISSRLDIGLSEGNIDGFTVKIYDRERIVQVYEGHRHSWH